MSERFVALQEQLELLGQTHIFSLLPGFSESHPVAQQLFALNIGDSIQHMQAAESNNFQAMEAKDIKPLRDVTNWDSLDTEMKGIVREKGISAIRCGSVAAVIMSGGQGTRLGFDGPKGMYCMGMPSGRCIFRMHMEKLLAMRSLASLSTGTSSLLTSTSTAGDSTATLCSLPVYIMTSDINTSVIKGYFHANDFFGYPETDVYFFEQVGQTPS